MPYNGSYGIWVARVGGDEGHEKFCGPDICAALKNGRSGSTRLLCIATRYSRLAPTPAGARKDERTTGVWLHRSRARDLSMSPCSILDRYARRAQHRAKADQDDLRRALKCMPMRRDIVEVGRVAG